jgi:hypothetical protein
MNTQKATEEAILEKAHGDYCHRSLRRGRNKTERNLEMEIPVILVVLKVL